ncbi:MAG: D-cysteine desulfhydrase family protein [Spirochaetales bacterium]|nr:D-cysteine desulfhydrase family protein [Spirochaetales bacterium]
MTDAGPERLRFAHLPTAIEEMPRLSAALGGPRLFVKRDDQTGLALGGNKTRKLEFLVAEAVAQGANLLISAGAIQSNHCRQTAAAAARYGLDCTLVLTGDMPVQASANFLLDTLLGVNVVNVPDRKDRDRVLGETFERASAEGKKPYLVPYGGSSPVGALGYAFAVEELMTQVGQGATGGSSPEWIVFGTSSGGTHAGLTLGKRLFGYPGSIMGVSIDESEAWLKNRVSSLASDASALLGPRIDFGPQDVTATDEYCAAGYGVFTAAEREAIGLFARHEGLLLDPVYTGRAAAGLVDMIRKGVFRKDETVLFWHTGGQPALFADRYAPQL